MTYEVVIQPEADEEMEAAYAWISQQAPASAATWYNGLIDALQSLAIFPARCPLAREDEAFPDEIRQLSYRNYRIIFVILRDQVRILHVRHSARTSMKWPED